MPETFKIASAKTKAYRDGLWAEHAAAFFLRLKGYRILARRYKTPVGEIDLIARKKNVIAMVEVKERQSVDAALFSLTRRMRQRIERAAMYYMASATTPTCDIRFDLIAVALPFSIRHLDNAWRPGA